MDTGPEALDRLWRRGAALIVIAILVVGLILGLLVLPRMRAGHGGFSADMRHAIGFTAAPTMAPGTKAPSDVVWTAALVNRLSTATGTAAPAAAAVCAGCHGPKGVSPVPTYPNLAGQSVAAIYKELKDFKSGARASPIMAPMAQPLSDDQMLALAAHFSHLPRGAPDTRHPAAANPRVVQLIEHGDPVRALPPCAACHGVDAAGPLGTPTLSGQHETYLAAQLHAFASGERHNDLFRRMRSVASKLTPEEINALADYYSRQ